MSQERENPNVVAEGHSCARRSPYGSSPFNAIPVRFPPAGRYSRKRRALAEKYDSMSPWKSRWSLVRLVKIPTSNRTPSIRPCAALWEDTSISRSVAPRATASAVTAWSSWGNGVVNPFRRTVPATR